MFKEKAMIVTPKKENVVVNMIWQLPPIGKYLKMWYLKKKSLSRTRVWLIN
jgi:hypothetical protein